MSDKFDITGRTFSKITVLGPAPSKSGHRYFTCRCSCGTKDILIRGSHLRMGNIKSCGCSLILDMTGQEYGYLVIERFLHSDDGNAHWECLCVCGAAHAVSRTNLKNGSVKSCGCKSAELTEATSMDRYGVPVPSQSPQIRAEIERSNMEKYGVKCTFELESVKEKSRQTCLEKYGVDHPMKDHDTALKVAKAQNNAVILTHWKTGAALTCVASYERRVVEYLNEHQINFKWQHRTFTMPDGRTFRPDCYLIGRRRPWIEIKGYFRGDAEEKWGWFAQEHPNSELWDEPKLKKMGIL